MNKTLNLFENFKINLNEQEESSTNNIESIKSDVWKEFWDNNELYNLMAKSSNKGENIEEVLKNTDWALNIKNKYNLNNSDFNNLIHYLCYHWNINATPRSIHSNNSSEFKESYERTMEQEKEELEDAKEALKNPNLKGDERTEYQHDVSRLENKPNLTEAYIEDEFDFSINTGVFDGDIPEIEKKYNLKIENITEPDAHHNPIYRVSGTKEDLINWIESEKLYDEDNNYLEYIHESTKVDLDKEDKEFDEALNKFLSETNSKSEGDSYRESGWYSQRVIFSDNSKGTFWWHAIANNGDVTIHGKDINNSGLSLDELIKNVNKKLAINESDINSIIADKGILNELKQFEDKIIRDAFLNMCELEQISTKNQIQVFQECRRLSGQEPLSENN